MITNLSIKYDLSKSMAAYTIQPSYTPALGDNLKLYVPLLMSGIKQGTPKIESVAINSVSLFYNAPSCKPKFSNIVKTQNYITLKSDAYSDDWNGLDNIIYDEFGYVASRNLPANVKVQCDFTSNTFKDGVFTPYGYPEQLPNNVEELTPDVSKTHVKKLYASQEDTNNKIGGIEETIEDMKKEAIGNTQTMQDSINSLQAKIKELQDTLNSMK